MNNKNLFVSVLNKVITCNWITMLEKSWTILEFEQEVIMQIGISLFHTVD